MDLLFTIYSFKTYCIDLLFTIYSFKDKGLFTPNESQKYQRGKKDQRIKSKHQRNFSLTHSLSLKAAQTDK